MQRYLPSAVPDDDMRAASILSARPPTLAAPSPVFQIPSSAAWQSPWSSRYYLRSLSFSSPVIAPFRRTTVEPIAHRLPATNVRFSKCRWRCHQSLFKSFKDDFLNKSFIYMQSQIRISLLNVFAKHCLENVKKQYIKNC